MNLQCPPNLSYDDFPRLLEAGINDWGGVSPVTIDHVNPEAPWPEIELLAAATRARRARAGAAPAGVPRVPRLRVARPARAAGGAARRPTRSGLAREDGWSPGEERPVPVRPARRAADRHCRRARRGRDRPSLPGARRGAPARLRGRRPAPPRGERRRRHLRRHAEHPVHERLLLQVRLLRVLEGQAGREPARARLPRPARRDRRAASPRRGSAARPRSACRAASIRPSTATTTSRSSGR